MYDSYKDRLHDAKKKAMEEDREDGYIVILSNNDIICYSAYHVTRNHTKDVRVTVDKITDQDVKILHSLPSPIGHIKEIKCRLFSSNKFVKRIYDHLNNLCQ